MENGKVEEDNRTLSLGDAMAIVHQMLERAELDNASVILEQIVEAKPDFQYYFLSPLSNQFINANTLFNSHTKL